MPTQKSKKSTETDNQPHVQENGVGYVKIWRKSFGNRMYFAEPFTRWQAWIDLLLLAAHETHDVYIRGVKMTLERGQALTGEDYLARRWKWSRGKVRRYMSELSSKTVQQIVQQKNNVCTVTTILNYNEYQNCSTAGSTPDGTTDGHQTVQQTDTHKNGNNVKKGKNNYSVEFETWWIVYKKGNKANAFKRWKEHAVTPDEIMDSTKTYIAYCQKTNRTMLDGEGFINQRAFENDWSDTGQGLSLAKQTYIPDEPPPNHVGKMEEMSRKARQQMDGVAS